MSEPLKVDLAVIGAGAAGLSVAAGAAQLGLSVVLFERGEMGGDCLNFGCVPSKALIAAAQAAADARAAGRLGVRAELVIDFAAVMAHVKAAVAAIAPHDSQPRFESLGVRVVRGEVRFTGPQTLETAGLRVAADRIVVASGSKPRIPAIPGLEGSGYLTTETVWDLKAPPRRLIVLGGGAVGLELGQAFRRLGSEVVLLEAGQVLAREDADVAAPLLAQLRADGVDLRTGVEATAVTRRADELTVSTSAGAVEGSHLLVAIGRTLDYADLDLGAAGVEMKAGKPVLDRALRTTNRRVSVLGDAAGQGAYTHLAGAHASLFVKKALFAQRVDTRDLVVARCLYADPEIAVVGLTEQEARAAHGDGVRVEIAPFSGNDRAIAEGDTRGLAKLVTDKKGRILGAAITGRHAGELIHPWIMALASRGKLRAFTDYIAPYPTRAEAGRRAASQWYAPLLFSDRTRRLVSLLKRLP